MMPDGGKQVYGLNFFLFLFIYYLFFLICEIIYFNHLNGAKRDVKGIFDEDKYKCLKITEIDVDLKYFDEEKDILDIADKFSIFFFY